jgi:hypothetical protein
MNLRQRRARLKQRKFAQGVVTVVMLLVVVGFLALVISWYL